MIKEQLVTFLCRYQWVLLRSFTIRGAEPELVATRQRPVASFESERLADDLIMELRGHCDAHEITQRYALWAYDNESNLLGKHFLRLEPSIDNSSPLLQAENIELELVRLAQSHATDAWRLFSQSSRGMMLTMAQENSRLSNRCRELEARHLETHQLQANLEERKHERVLEVQEQANGMQLRQRVMGQLEQMAPYVIGAITKSGPLDKLMKSLEPNQWQTIMSMITPEQQQLLVDVLKLARGSNDAVQQLMNPVA